jgi:hypothetical protein
VRIDRVARCGRNKQQTRFRAASGAADGEATITLVLTSISGRRISASAYCRRFASLPSPMSAQSLLPVAAARSRDLRRALEDRDELRVAQQPRTTALAIRMVWIS